MESRGVADIMSELFDAKAYRWDASSRRQALAQRVYEGIIAAVPLHRNMNIIDLGAGTGLLTFKVLPHVKRIVALDTSEAMLQKLQEKKGATDNLSARLHDISQEPLEGLYDGVMSSMTLHHIKETERLLRHLYKNLNKGGFIALADLCSEAGTFHGDGNEGVHHFGFDERSLRMLVSSVGFENVAFEIVDVIQKEQQYYPIFLLTAFK